jgi:hypothetical protein
MLGMRSVSICCCLLPLVMQICSGDSVQEKTSSVRLFVLDNFGIAIRSPFDVEARDANTGAVVRRARDMRSGDKFELPYGSYFVEIIARGSETYVTKILVDRPEIWVPAGLNVGRLGVRAIPCSLSGKVSRVNGAQVWLKLIALYSYFVAHSAADKEGRFVFRDIRPGKYLLLTFWESELHDSRAVEVRGAENISVP